MKQEDRKTAKGKQAAPHSALGSGPQGRAASLWNTSIEPTAGIGILASRMPYQTFRPQSECNRLSGELISPARFKIYHLPNLCSLELVCVLTQTQPACVIIQCPVKTQRKGEV